MIKVGLTGGIGSGKTMVCRVFESLGVPVYYADLSARFLVDNRQDIRDELIALLGKDIYDKQGLNRPLFSSRVFQHKQLLEKANYIIHPKVRDDFYQWAEKYRDLDYVIEEAAILFESGGNRMMDKCITVIAPLEIRMERVMKRAGMTRERILDIMNNQWPDEEKAILSDFVITNDEKSLILPQLLLIHQEFINTR
jgi:dephospho-CoA kinase